jgi:LPXTG-motif cell wall-anchored protein
MRIGRFLAGASALTAIGLLVAPGAASAHTAEVNPSCDGLSVTVGLYDPSVVTTITIDGQSTQKNGNGTWNSPWDSTMSHTWAVKITDPVDHQDRTFGPRTQDACVTPTTTTTTAPPAPPPTEPATTTTAPGATTTTSAGTTTTTTTAAGAPTTTIAGGSSNSGGSGRTSVAASSGSLPATGSASPAIAFAAAGLLVAGAALRFAARRPTS